MIGIIDYGLGNVRAFANVYKRLNTPCRICTKSEDLAGATHVILPGVGAFDEAIQLLQASGIRDTLEDLVVKQKMPVMGICVGMQLLADSSEEGKLSGLGWIKGVVRKMESTESMYRTSLPHMGWNNVNPKQEKGLFQNLEEDSRFYFLHSYYFECANDVNSIALTNYGKAFSCAVNSKNIYGVQFHPEKSHGNGIRLLQNFARI